MRQTPLAFAAVALLLLTAFALAIVGGTRTQAQPVLPTPKGQLGGPMPLPTAAPGQPPSSPTPAPTSTPAGSPTSDAEAPDTPDCRIAPRSLDNLVALAVGDALPATKSVEAGARADQVTVDAVTVTVVQLVSCLNAGDQLRAAALFTDDHLNRNLAATGWSPEEAAAILSPLLPRLSERRITIRDISDIQLLPDGRASAMVVLIDPDQFTFGAVTTRQLVIVKEGDHWLVDGIVGD